ncbi:MAG: hypothetical protein NZM25_02660 [Leptospiraceae bacterium]|nr:hypothetical protein [Leptospiraceae bacterium]MDW8307170.1 hypothetical protein [Leptospiraceae bacterium]
MRARGLLGSRKKVKSQKKDEAHQLEFQHCVHCGEIVERTFQKSICEKCLTQSFKELRKIINETRNRI